MVALLSASDVSAPSFFFSFFISFLFWSTGALDASTTREILVGTEQSVVYESEIAKLDK